MLVNTNYTAPNMLHAVVNRRESWIRNTVFFRITAVGSCFTPMDRHSLDLRINDPLDADSFFTLYSLHLLFLHVPVHDVNLIHGSGAPRFSH